MIRSTIQFWYTRGPRVAIKSPLTRDRLEQEITLARESGSMLVLESLPENPRENTKGDVFIYLDMLGIAWISITEEKEPESLIKP